MSDTSSKLEEEHVEKGVCCPAISPHDALETRRILRKVDYRLIPLLTVMYLISFIDRANIGNAKIAGMNDDLKLTGIQYNIVLTVFFISYALLEVPSNIILKLTRPSIWMPSIMLGWGIVMTLMGLVRNFRELAIARFFLGIPEAGLFPGAAFLLTTWYRRYEVQSRMAVFYSGASLSGAFSGILAYGIQHMDGVAGLGGWRWIFILEGIVTVIVAVSMFFLLPNNPGSAKFLTQEERDFLINRLRYDNDSGAGQQAQDEKLTLKHIYEALKDWRIYIAVVILWGSSVGGYSFSFTIPSIVKGLGYTAANAQLLTIPIYLCAAIVATVFAVVSDRFKQRSPFIIAGCTVAALGLVGLLAAPKPEKPGLTYGFLFVVVSGYYSFLVPTICWVANNLSPSSKRAVGMAALISIGNLGGIASSNIFMASEEPEYWTGYGVCLGLVLVAIAAALILRYSFSKDNQRKEAMTEEEVRETFSESELMALGDRSPLFKYTL